MSTCLTGVFYRLKRYCESAMMLRKNVECYIISGGFEASWLTGINTYHLNISPSLLTDSPLGTYRWRTMQGWSSGNTRTSLVWTFVCVKMSEMSDTCLIKPRFGAMWDGRCPRDRYLTIHCNPLTLRRQGRRGAAEKGTTAWGLGLDHHLSG